MRVAYVANIRFPTEKAHGIQIAKACEALIKAGEEVTLLVPRRRTHIAPPPLAYYGIKTSFVIRTLFTLDWVGFGIIGFWIESALFAFSVARYIRAHPYDVVYGRDELVLAILGWFGISNIVWESHDGTWNGASRFVARTALGVVVVTHGAKDFYIEHGVPAEKIYSVANGIDLAQFANAESKEAARRRLGLPQNKTIALYIGRLDGWKGTATLLEASTLLPDGYCVALIGGETKQIEALQKKYPHALFLGYRPYSELQNNQAAGDVLIVPNTAKDEVSVRFTSPLKLLAHMASHRPIVASDIPSIRELVDEHSAVLVAPDSPQALAEGIQNAVDQTRLADAAFERVSKFDWSARARGIIDFARGRLATTGR